jgi:hypothetical protein
MSSPRALPPILLDDGVPLGQHRIDRAVLTLYAMMGEDIDNARDDLTAAYDAMDLAPEAALAMISQGLEAESAEILGVDVASLRGHYDYADADDLAERRARMIDLQAVYVVVRKSGLMEKFSTMLRGTPRT